MSVDPESLVESLPVGETTTLSFTVTNHGVARLFDVAAIEENGFVSRVAPTRLDLGMDESAVVEVDLSVPSSTAGDTVALLSVNVVATSAPEIANTAVVELPVEGNRPPDCSGAGPSLELWPPNHRLEEIDLAATLDVTDPDGEPVSFTVTSVTQDEPVSGTGSGDTSPDATGVGTGTAAVRVERDGAGNGRVYEIGFTASDASGGSCTGSFIATVPHSQVGEPAVDDGQVFDSTMP